MSAAILPTPNANAELLRAAQTYRSAHESPNKSSASERAMHAAKEYEGVFLSLMMKEMFSGLKTEGDFTGGFGEEMFRDMLSEQYAQTIADTGGIGLADSIYREILTLQEVGNQ